MGTTKTVEIEASKGVSVSYKEKGTNDQVSHAGVIGMESTTKDKIQVIVDISGTSDKLANGVTVTVTNDSDVLITVSPFAAMLISDR